MYFYLWQYVFHFGLIHQLWAFNVKRVCNTPGVIGTPPFHGTKAIPRGNPLFAHNNDLGRCQKGASAILVCGGVGQRINDVFDNLDSSNANVTILDNCPRAKQFILVHGVPIFIYSFAEFVRSSLVSEVTIATKPEWHLKVLELVDCYTQKVPSNEAFNPEDISNRIENPLHKDYIIHVNGRSDSGYMIPREASIYPADSARIEEYRLHLSRYSFVLFDLDSQRCVLSTSSLWPEALSIACSGSPGRYKLVKFCLSGDTRGSTVYNSLTGQNVLGAEFPVVTSSDGIVLVHDAARPMLRRVDMGHLIASARRYGGAIPAIGVVDTIKVGESTGDVNFVFDTPVRSSLFAVQTPQAFVFSVLRTAYEKAMESGTMSMLTDDSSFVERLGTHRVCFVPGHRMNIKLTTSYDLPICSSYLKEIYFP
ncbi:2-C-methyl-D-erythritol 4-phosphate cytidylyltransferase family protein [Babesia bovis T2Bo]|uniref:2-C-methyl-D-erythritol 4-phosphate cytidylyltransferase family protein n=1 Tax=Babesia bovis T2Bo TaxID=484906 RepID=UPI001C35D998|nr:2-C-methyl-D-erythritol 4-phosphate cytidylyltransferase family protein [Babesia bovis T2Bo]EDO07913.2 2-C-methyl-D-erythritol 4-phosphate cytidylyltransferase family protein [Babesia bovis T2Bo]